MSRHTTKTEDARKAITDLKVHGDPDLWVLLAKASSESAGIMKATKAMELPGGCLVQVSTERVDAHGNVAVAEAMAFVPGVRIDKKHGRLVGTKDERPSGDTRKRGFSPFL